MADEAGDLDLMHRENHRGRAAGAAEDGADVGDIGRARAFAAELGRNQHAEQFLFADRLERLLGKARVAIDRVGMTLGDLRRRFRAADEIARLDGFAGAGATIAGRDQADGRGHLGTPRG